MPARLDALRWGGIDFTRVQAIAGTGIGTKLIPELVEFKPFGDTLPELFKGLAKVLRPGRLEVPGLEGNGIGRLDRRSWNPQGTHQGTLESNIPISRQTGE